jgi:excisionase family DNA binding protein
VLPELLDVEEVAARLRVSVRQGRRPVFERRIPFLKIGSLVRFDPNEVAAWLSTLRVDACHSRLRPSTSSARDRANSIGRLPGRSAQMGLHGEAIPMRRDNTAER